MFKAPIWYLVLLGTSAIISLVTIVRLQKEETADLNRFLLLLLGAVFLWTTMAFFDNLGISLAISYTFTKLTYLGIPVVATAWLLVAIEYTDRGDFVSKRLLAVLAIEPILVNVAVWTNEIHELFWPLVWSETGPVIDGHGPLFFLHAAYLYVLTLIGVVVVADVIVRRQRMFQKQSVLLGLAALVPLVANVLFVIETDSPGALPQPIRRYVTAALSVDLTPPAFLLSGGLFYWAIVKENVTSISPIARQTVIDTMGAAMFVMRDGRLSDVNRQGKRLLAIEDGEDVVGTPVEDLLDAPDLFTRFDDVDETTETVRLDLANGRRYYEVEVSPVVDGVDHVGRLFLVQDITDRVDRQNELERKNDQLESFASVVSHDLRNPLTVAKGYVENIAELADDEAIVEYAREAQGSHERIETLIEDILSMARESDSIDDPDPVSLWSVARNAWGTVDTAEMSLEPAEPQVTETVVLGDSDRLQRLFENCFRNAREHGGSDVTVTVGVSGFEDSGSELEPGGHAFWIADDGNGIPESDQDSVFQKGYTTNPAGTGFGLAIVSEIVTAHGWSVHAAESDTGGAKFVFENIVPAE